MSSSQPLDKDQLEAMWPKFQAYLQNSAQSCIQEVLRVSDATHRNQIFRMIIRKLGGGIGASTTDLNYMIIIGDAAIDHALKTADQHKERKDQWIDEANISAYNLSANLYDCWSEDQRLEEHFSQGLRLAERAIEFRKQLNKGPRPFAMAYWAKGKHLMSLGRFVEAVEALKISLDFEMKGHESNATTPGLMAAEGYLAMAQFQLATQNLSTLSKSSDREAADDAQFYLEQMHRIRRLV